MAPAQTPKKDPIAIVGSGCRFPGGASSPSKLWELLKCPRDVLREIPTSRFNASGFHHDNPEFPGHANVKHSYVLDENVAQFDAQFFNINSSEAAAMDPQQRVLLETVYETGVGFNHRKGERQKRVDSTRERSGQRKAQKNMCQGHWVTHYNFSHLISL